MSSTVSEMIDLDYPPMIASAKGLGPILLCFRSTPPAEKLELEVRRKGGVGGGERMRVTAKGQRVSYDGATRPMYGEQMLIGVRKKGSNKVRLVRLTASFGMDSGAVDAEPIMAQGGDAAAAPSSVAGARSLVAQLGSEKARKRLQREANKLVSHDSVLGGEHVNELVRSALEAANETAVAVLSEQEKRPAHPRFVLGAPSAREAYPRDGLVPEMVWVSLDAARLDAAARSQQQLATMEKDEYRVWPAIVLRVLRNNLPVGRPAPSTSGSERVELLRALLYLTYMCRFNSIKRAITPNTDSSKGESEVLVGEDEEHPLARKLGIPKLAWLELLVAFSEAQGGATADDVGVVRRITERTRQKLAMHAIALALWIGDGKSDSTELAQMLSLTTKQAGLYIRQLGCTFGKTRGSTAIELTLPLELPRIEQGRAAPKKR